jgi:hypothetical protein
MSEKLWKKASKWKVTMYDGEEVTVEAEEWEIMQPGGVLVFRDGIGGINTAAVYNHNVWVLFVPDRQGNQP